MSVCSDNSQTVSDIETLNRTAGTLRSVSGQFDALARAVSYLRPWDLFDDPDSDSFLRFERLIRAQGERMGLQGVVEPDSPKDMWQLFRYYSSVKCALSNKVLSLTDKSRAGSEQRTAAEAEALRRDFREALDVLTRTADGLRKTIKRMVGFELDRLRRAAAQVEDQTG
jgi:hypothetical protein